MDYISQLPLDLFIPIIFLSCDTPDPVNRLIRIESLRLVSKAWHDVIDSTPLFWTCIPNVARSFPQTISRWIRKSGEVPLHVIFTRHGLPLNGFMQSLIPHCHRWRKLEIVSSRNCISESIDAPAPVLEELIISHALLSPNKTPFGGITPSLASVRLLRVSIPENTHFLKNLKHLRLQSIHYPSGIIPIGKLYDILNACLGLEDLDLDANYIYHPMEQPPIVLAKLSRFRLIGYGSSSSVAAILGAVIASHLADFYLLWNGNWVPPGLSILSPLSTDFLGIHKLRPRYQISISSHRFVLSTIVTQPDTRWYPNLIVERSIFARPEAVTLELLQCFEKAAPQAATVDLVLDQSHSIRTIFDYLKSTVQGTNDKLDHPIPQLQSIQVDIVGRDETTSDMDLLTNLAQVRRDIGCIRLRRLIDQAPGDSLVWVYQWNPLTSKFEYQNGA